MALKAGRVGIRPELVDSEGNLKGGGTAGVTDVRVDGVSVVEDGQADIILPVQRLQETDAPSDADICVMTVGENGNLSSMVANRLKKQSVTIDGTSYDVAVYEESGSTSTIAVTQGQKIVFTRGVDYQLKPTFSTTLQYGVTGRMGCMVVLPTDLQYIIGTIVNPNQDYITYEKTASLRSLSAISPTFKFYKIV